MSTVKGVEAKFRSAKILVIGGNGVGKSALIVRYVTHRYIHDYDPLLESLQAHTSEIDGKTVTLHILDTAGLDFPNLSWDKEVRWADGYILVCSVTDKQSLRQIYPIWNYIARLRGEEHPPIVLVANKTDMIHQRCVSSMEIAKVASDLKCPSFELAVSEDIERVSLVFITVYRVIKTKVKSEKKLNDGDHRTHRIKVALNIFKKEKPVNVDAEEFKDVLLRGRTYTM